VMVSLKLRLVVRPCGHLKGWRLTEMAAMEVKWP